MHLLHVVDCPDMHGEAGTMGPSNESPIDEGNLSRVGRNLKAVAFRDFAA
jgi:hypothetical protein